MSLTKNQVAEISALLKRKIRQKLENYHPETQSMPFHVRLLGKDRMANYSFIQSINTSLGTSIFEQVGKIIATSRFPRVEHQYKGLGTQMSADAHSEIQRIIGDLDAKRVQSSNKLEECVQILAVADHSPKVNVKRPTIDLFVTDIEGTEYYFELKTAKPNRGQIFEFKRILLEWYAIRSGEKPDAKIKTLLVIPYNPYFPEPFARWTFDDRIDTSEELMVAEEFWDFLGGEGTYDDLLTVFEQVGLELRPEIDKRFASFS